MPDKLSRRKLLKFGAMAAAGLGTVGALRDVVTAATADTGTSEWKPGDPVGYINPTKIPSFDLPPFRGERYEATVPDTLDISERARLAVNVLTEATDPLADYESYDGFAPLTNPPSMAMNQWYFPYEEGHGEALTQNRLICGSDQNLNVEQRWMEVTLKQQGPDGLLYVPLKGRPWALKGFQIRDIETPRGDQILEPYVCASMLRTISIYARRDPNGPWSQVLRRLVDGMASLEVVNGDSAYYWPSNMYATKDRPAHPPIPTRPFEIEASQVPLGLMYAYRVLDYEPALVLAKKNINYLRTNFYAEDGRFLAAPGLKLQAHGGAHLRGLLAMEQYAEATGDKEMMGFVVRSFEHARFLGSNYIRAKAHSYDLAETPGAALVGFFPEWTDSPVWQTSETDQVAVMLTLAMRLSEAGIGDYWDDADRRIRNQFAENQLVETDWMYEAGKNGPPAKKANNVTTDRVPERIKGGFAGSPSVNDWAGRKNAGMGACCTAYGCNGLSWIWERTLRHQDGQLKVNLLLNRASEWADVDSYIPYQGRVDVKVKKPVDLSIRIPEWVTPDQAKCQVNKQDRQLGWNGRYAKVGGVKPGDVATLTFPISERTDKVWIEKREYTLVRKGNEVVSIDPPGVIHPFYQRQHYRQNEPRMKRVTRFVSNEKV
jgi:hypothetical protein